MKKETKVGIYQALGVTAYCSLVGLVFWKGEEIFGNMNSVVGPISFLVMFSVSALVCGLLVFYNPYKLFFQGKKGEAIEVVVSTTVSLAIILLILFSVLILL